MGADRERKVGRGSKNQGVGNIGNIMRTGMKRGIWQKERWWLDPSERLNPPPEWTVDPLITRVRFAGSERDAGSDRHDFVVQFQHAEWRIRRQVHSAADGRIFRTGPVLSRSRFADLLLRQVTRGNGRGLLQSVPFLFPNVSAIVVFTHLLLTAWNSYASFAPAGVWQFRDFRH